MKSISSEICIQKKDEKSMFAQVDLQEQYGTLCLDFIRARGVKKDGELQKKSVVLAVNTLCQVQQFCHQYSVGISVLGVSVFQWLLFFISKQKSSTIFFFDKVGGGVVPFDLSPTETFLEHMKNFDKWAVCLKKGAGEIDRVVKEQGGNVQCSYFSAPWGENVSSVLLPDHKLAFGLFESCAGVECVWEYCSLWFSERSTVRLQTLFETILLSVMNDPQQQLAQHHLWFDRQLGRASVPLAFGCGQIVSGSQATSESGSTAAENGAPAYEDVCQAIEKNALLRSAHIAVQFKHYTFSYVELNSLANQIARFFLLQGLLPGDRVGICLERGLDMVATVLATLKSGLTYIPLDPSYPSERIRYILEDVCAKGLITDSFIALNLRSCFSETIWCIDDLDSQLSRLDSQNLEQIIDPELLAYIIYTSGSTGNPKGVMVPRRCLNDFIHGMAHNPYFSTQVAQVLVLPEDRFAAVTTLAFDIAILELLLPLSIGATVLVARSEVTTQGGTLSNWLREARATILQATPSTWELLRLAHWRAPEGFRGLVGGEAMSSELAAFLVDQSVQRQSVTFWNIYGPTETTVWSTAQKLVSVSDAKNIGQPLLNEFVMIVDEFGQLLPEGCPGELWIGGAGITRGYWQRPDLTQKVFTEQQEWLERFCLQSTRNDIKQKSPSAWPPLLYHTGDLALMEQLDQEGAQMAATRRSYDSVSTYRDVIVESPVLRFFGRLDAQVKFRGFRVELGEIEARLRRHPNVADGAVALIDGVGQYSVQILCAFYISEQVIPVESLQAHLSQTLAPYLMPQRFRRLSALPMTPNNKLDRKQLCSLFKAEESQVVNSKEIEDYSYSEQYLIDLWSELLGGVLVTPSDNFYDLGGHSLVAMKFISEVLQQKSISISPSTLMTSNLRVIAEQYFSGAGGERGGVASHYLSKASYLTVGITAVMGSQMVKGFLARWFSK